MDVQQLLPLLRQALPRVLAWIDGYVAKHEAEATPVLNFGFPGLLQHYGADLLRSSRVVLVERVVAPPMAAVGLPQFAAFNNLSLGGITYRNVYFVDRQQARREDLHFHELVHVTQWDELGPEAFLKLYGVQLAAFGYERAPLEQTAYGLQRMFVQGTVPGDLVAQIRQDARRQATEVPGVLGEREA
jgi:hypothetical protein